MTQINLPKLNQTGANEWADVEDNDKAIRDVVNGNLDSTNLAADAVGQPELQDGAVGRAETLKSFVQGTRVASTGTTTVACVWDVPFADTNYTVTYSLENAGVVALSHALTAKSTTGATVTFAGTVATVTVHFIGIHN